MIWCCARFDWRSPTAHADGGQAVQGPRIRARTQPVENQSGYDYGPGYGCTGTVERLDRFGVVLRLIGDRRQCLPFISVRKGVVGVLVDLLRLGRQEPLVNSLCLGVQKPLKTVEGPWCTPDHWNGVVQLCYPLEFWMSVDGTLYDGFLCVIIEGCARYAVVFFQIVDNKAPSVPSYVPIATANPG